MFNTLMCDRPDGHSFLIEYYQACARGDVLVGQELMTQLEHCMQDLFNEQVRFYLEAPHKRIRFIETQCKHFEAPYAGRPFLLELFQKAFIEALFGFQIYDKEIGRWVRKYQDALYLVGRKNGKTPFIGAICLAEFFCGPTGLKILCASNDYEQADLMFQAINAMREESPSLERVTRKNIKGIFFGNVKQKKKTGKFSKQNKAQIRKLSARAGAKEGRNIGVGAVDEVFEMQDDSLVMPIRQALSTQDEPLYFELTTEGFTQDGYLDHRLARARQVLRGELESPRWLIWLYTQDSEAEIWQDEKTWVKSNPGLGSIKKWGFLRGLMEEARRSTSVRAFVLAKEFNIKQNNAQSWLQASEIYNQETFDMEEIRGNYYIGGVDISETTDLTSARAIVLKNVNDRIKKYSVTMYFVPEAKADAQLSDQNGTNPEHKNYREWARQGYVTIIPGNEIDTSYITRWFWALLDTYDLKPYKIGYDNWDAKAMVKELKDMFGEDVPVRVPMRPETLTNPMRVIELDLRAQDIVYNQNPVDRWCLENVGIKSNDLGLIMPVKVQGQSKLRIDGALSLIICYAALGWHKTEYMNIIQ